MAKLTTNGRMVMERGDILMDMISGRPVKVASVKKNVTKLEDGREISEKEIDCFQFIDNEREPLITNKEDFAIRSGKFFYQEEQIKTGTLEVQEILFAIPDGVVVKAFDGRKKLIGIYKYYVENDAFVLVCRDITSAKVLYEDEDGVSVVKTVKVSEHKVIPADAKPDDEPVTMQGVEELTFIFLDGDVKGTTDQHFADEVQVVKKDCLDDNKKVILVSVAGEMFSEQITDEKGYTFKTLIPAEGGLVEELILTKVYDFTDEESGDDELFLYTVRQMTATAVLPDKVEKVSVMNDKHDSMFIVTEGGITFVNSARKRQAVGADVTAAAAKYPVLVKFQGVGAMTEFVLANKEYETATVTVHLTEDRGYVTEVTEG